MLCTAKQSPHFMLGNENIIQIKIFWTHGMLDDDDDVGNGGDDDFHVAQHVHRFLSL